MVDPRQQQALSQEQPEVRPILEQVLTHQDRLNAATRKRDGIGWRLDQIPERALSREGEERQKLLDRAAALEKELRPEIVEAEKLRLEGVPLEVELRLKRIEVLVAGIPEAKTIFDEYAAKLRQVGNPSAMDIEAFADAVIESKRLNREGILRGEYEQAPEQMEANGRITDLLGLFENEQQQRNAIVQEYEPKLSRLIQPMKAKRRK